jgi:hypothetical protein
MGRSFSISFDGRGNETCFKPALEQVLSEAACLQGLSPPVTAGEHGIREAERPRFEVYQLNGSWEREHSDLSVTSSSIEKEIYP